MLLCFIDKIVRRLASRENCRNTISSLRSKPGSETVNVLNVPQRIRVLQDFGGEELGAVNYLSPVLKPFLLDEIIYTVYF